MAENQRMRIGGFVIMPNHVHLLFRVGENHLLKNVQRDFLKYTAQQIKFDLQQNHPQVLEHFIARKTIKVTRYGNEDLLRFHYIPER